jgi:spore cortex biosynthesis protein YabQ
MINEVITKELACFSAMVFYGVVAAFCYHLLLFFRAVLHHSRAVIDAEDILFLAVAGICFFLTVYKQNDGILRWYTFAGAGLGCLAYVRTLGASLEAVRKRLLQKHRKTVKIRAKFSSKGQVPTDEGSSPKFGKKEKKKKRS